MSDTYNYQSCMIKQPLFLVLNRCIAESGVLKGWLEVKPQTRMQACGDNSCEARAATQIGIQHLFAC